MKLNALLSLLLIVAAPLQATVYYPHNVSQKDVNRAIVEGNVLFGYDLHDVVVKANSSKKRNAVLANVPNLIGTMLNFLFGFITRSKTSVRNAYAEISKLPKALRSHESTANIFAKHGETKLAHMMLKVGNAYKVQPGMEQLLRDMKKAGYQQYYASNIGPQLFRDLTIRFKTKYHSNIFDILTFGLMVDYTKIGKPMSTPSIPNAVLAPTGKPDIPFYELFKQTFAKNSNSLIIFIDNNLENVRNAVQTGMVGIHFAQHLKKDRGTQKLRLELRSLGVNI